MRFTPKIITILIMGVVAFTATAVFSAEDYNSSRSNTQTSIPNDQEKAISAVNSGLELVKDEIVVPDPSDDTPQPAAYIRFGGVSGEADEAISIPDAGDDVQAGSKRTRYSNITLKRSAFHDTAMNAIRNIKSVAPEERENLKDELKVRRETFKTEILSMNLSIRENAKELREKFRENVGTTGADWDYKRTALIAVAHGKGLRMLNRFRSVIARFDHILGRLESRIEKLEARGYPTDSFFDVFTSIEEAKNISVENKAKLEELKAKYESLLLGENVKGVAEEARAIAKELKAEIETLRAKLIKIADDIRQAAGDYNSSISNSSTL